MKIIVCGYMIRHPVGGNLMAYFHYVLGLHRLGHEVLYFEENGWPNSCYNPVTQEYSDNPNIGLRSVQILMASYGLKVTVCYVNRDNGNIAGNIKGASWKDIKRMLGESDLVLNVGGVCWISEFHLCRRRVLIDMDPFFTQVGVFGSEEGINDYHHYFSYGVNIGRNDCTIPTGGFDWRPTVPPVVPEIWQRPLLAKKKQVESESENIPFTTVTNWNAYSSVIYSKEHYGQKDEEILRLIDLPMRTSQKLEIALSGANPEIWARLHAMGWSLQEGWKVSIDIPTYLAFISGSRGELSAAKNAYVKIPSGWFSDRSVCYLAAGRPVILQDMGFSKFIPTGKGLFAFQTMEDILTAVDAIPTDYEGNFRAARELASEYFAAEKVIGSLMERAGL